MKNEVGAVFTPNSQQVQLNKDIVELQELEYPAS